MFGYVIPDKLNMYVKDFYTYKAYYCGLCKSIGKSCGQCMRLTTNYDVTFLDMLTHSMLNKVNEFRNETCILSPLKKKTIAVGDEITKRVVDVNTLLSYYKLLDDGVDNKSFAKEFTRITVVQAKYNKAKQRLPEIDKFYAQEYGKLFELERKNVGGIDVFAEPFSLMLKETIKVLLGDKSNCYVEEMMYFLGKWIYVIDAIDDIDKDYKNKEFNPFLINYEYLGLDKFFEDKYSELEFLLMSCYNKIYENFNKLELKLNEGALTNIVWYGILMRTEDILRRENKCKKIRL